MALDDDDTHWFGRILGGIVVGVGAFLILTFESFWELTLTPRIAIAASFGLFFLLFGGNVWRWIRELEWWL